MLEIRRQELLVRWDRLTKILSELTQQRDAETRVEEQLRMDQRISKTELERSELEAQIEALGESVTTTSSPEINTMQAEQIRPITIFYSYAHEDQLLRDELDKHLSILKRQGIVKSWHDRNIGAGNEWAAEIDHYLKSADIILLLISPDFIASDYCWCKELECSMKRHTQAEARVIPIMLREVDWSGAPFSKLQALPVDAKPVTSWDNQDHAFSDICRGIRVAAQTINRSQNTAY